MRFIVHTVCVPNPGSIDTELRCTFWSDEFWGEERGDTNDLETWEEVGNTHGWVTYRQSGAHSARKCVDELIATGHQVCVFDRDQSLVRWLTSRPLPTPETYGDEQLRPTIWGAHHNNIRRYRFRRPAEFATRVRLPAEIVIFTEAGSETPYDELSRRLWFKDVPIDLAALQQWGSEYDLVGFPRSEVRP